MTYVLKMLKKSKYCHLKSKSHKEFEKYYHTILSLKNFDIKDVDEIICLYMIDHNKKFNQNLLKGHFNLVFNKIQDCKYIMTDMTNNTTNISWSNYLREAIDSLKKEGYLFDHINEMDIITLAHKRDLTYGFYLKHNMPAFEWKLNTLINKDEILINKFPGNWRHPINTKFNCCRKNKNLNGIRKRICFL